MGAVERLQAAIEKLEVFKGRSTPGPWVQVDAYNASPAGASVRISRSPTFHYNAYAGTPENAELIVTLHRTVDAQLAILYRGLVSVAPEREVAEMLADAILGGD